MLIGQRERLYKAIVVKHDDVLVHRAVAVRCSNDRLRVYLFDAIDAAGRNGRPMYCPPDVIDGYIEAICELILPEMDFLQFDIYDFTNLDTLDEQLALIPPEEREYVFDVSLELIKIRHSWKV